jgi:hypothetical protein
VLQVFVVASGLVTWPMFVVGLAFAGIWVYWLRLWPRDASSDTSGSASAADVERTAGH